jgi:hypothetical protein
MTDQELQRKVSHLDTTVYNANSYALSLEKRINDLERHNRTFLTMYIAGIMTFIFAAGVVILLA